MGVQSHHLVVRNLDKKNYNVISFYFFARVLRYIPSAVVAVVVVALVVVVFVVDVIVGVVVVVLQSARWEKSQTDDLKGKSLILKHSKKNLNLQSNSSLPKGQVISLVMHSGHSIRHAPDGPHSQKRPQSEADVRVKGNSDSKSHRIRAHEGKWCWCLHLQSSQGFCYHRRGLRWWRWCTCSRSPPATRWLEDRYWHQSQQRAQQGGGSCLFSWFLESSDNLQYPWDRLYTTEYRVISCGPRLREKRDFGGRTYSSQDTLVS